MTRSLSKSNAHFRQAVTRLPPGVSSNFRYLGDDKTNHVASGHGARFAEIDGDEHIEYRMAHGPCIPGCAGPRVDAAARALCDRHRRADCSPTSSRPATIATGPAAITLSAQRWFPSRASRSIGGYRS